MALLWYSSVANFSSSEYENSCCPENEGEQEKKKKNVMKNVFCPKQTFNFRFECFIADRSLELMAGGGQESSKQTSAKTDTRGRRQRELRVLETKQGGGEGRNLAEGKRMGDVL